MRRVAPFLAVALAALLVRVGVVVFWPRAGGLLRLEPSEIAANLNAGRGFVFEQYGAVYHAWKEPLYMALLAVLSRWVGDGDLPVIALQSVFGIATAVGVALIARHVLGDTPRAVAAGLLAAVNPFLVYYDTHVAHYLSLVTALFVALTATTLMAMRPGAQGRRWTWIAGLAWGAGLWARGTLLVAGLAGWIAAIVAGERARRRELALRTVLAVTIAALVILPWPIRNYAMLGRVVFVSDVPHQLWLGNNPLSNGTFSDAQGARIISRSDPAFRARIQGAPELAQYDLFLGEVKRFVAEQPAAFAALTARRLLAFVWFSPNAGVNYPPWQNVVGRAAYVVLLVVGIVGLVRYWRRVDQTGRARAVALLASVGGIALVHSLTAINMNHRVPLELVLSVFAAENGMRS
jgi:hypothetical protein